MKNTVKKQIIRSNYINALFYLNLLHIKEKKTTYVQWSAYTNEIKYKKDNMIKNVPFENWGGMVDGKLTSEYNIIG